MPGHPAILAAAARVTSPVRPARAPMATTLGGQAAALTRLGCGAPRC